METRARNVEARVGLFALIIVVILLWMSFLVGGWSLERARGYRVYVTFPQAQGITNKTGVYIAGIQVGEVDAVALVGGKARLTLRIHREVALEPDVRTLIRPKGLLGEKYVEIRPGTPGTGPVAPDADLPEGEAPPDLDQLIGEFSGVANDIRAVTRSLREALGGPEGAQTIKQIVENLRATSEILRGQVMENLASFSKILGENAPRIAENLGVLSETLASIATRNREVVSESLDQIRDASRKFDDSLDSLARITKKIDEGHGTLGKLVNDEATIQKINHTIDGIDSFVSRADKFRTLIRYRGEYETLERQVKSYVALRLQPREDKYYQFEVVDDPLPVSSEQRTTTTTTQGGTQTTTVTDQTVSRHQLKFSAEFAKRLADLTFRGGILESSAGVGLDLHALDDQATLSLEAFDFTRATNPYLKALLEVSLLKYFFLAGGVNDAANRDLLKQGKTDWYAGGGLRFDDEDLRYLLGFAGAAAVAGSR